MTTVRKPRKAALFDLDSTLTDHAAAFAAWADEFADSTSIPLAWLMRAEACHAGARHAFFANLKDTFRLQRSIASLHTDYRRRSAELVPFRPEVCSALQQLADDGWAMGVVTNGSPDAQRLKLKVTRLRPVLRLSGDLRRVRRAQAGSGPVPRGLGRTAGRDCRGCNGR